MGDRTCNLAQFGAIKYYNGMHLQHSRLQPSSKQSNKPWLKGIVSEPLNTTAEFTALLISEECET